MRQIVTGLRAKKSSLQEARNTADDDDVLENASHIKNSGSFGKLIPKTHAKWLATSKCSIFYTDT